MHKIKGDKFVKSICDFKSRFTLGNHEIDPSYLH